MQNSMGIAEDRISELPDSFLVNEILSRLSTKCVVRTTVLSKRWRWLWTNVPKLEFLHTCYNIYSYLDKAKTTMFINYVDNVLLRHQISNLRSFKLTCDGGIAKSLVYSWISSVVHPKLHELYVDFCELDHCVIPSSVYRYQSLKVLNLSFWLSVFKPPTSISLPSVASLEIHCAQFVDENLTQHFISSLPALKRLVMRECYFYNHHELVISAPSLKVLTLTKAYFKPNELGNWRIKICASKLDELYCQTNKPPREYILNVPVLQDACIYSENYYNPIVLIDKGLCRRNACDLLKQIVHVKKLSIHAELLKVLPHEDLLNHLPTFTNLTHLSVLLEHCWGRDLLSMLRIMPNLEDLRVDKVYASSADDMTLHIGEMLPSCFQSKIKIFQCIYHGFSGDLHMIDFLLCNIAAFKIIEIIDEDFLSHPIKIVRLGRHPFIPKRPLGLIDLLVPML